MVILEIKNSNVKRIKLKKKSKMSIVYKSTFCEQSKTNANFHCNTQTINGHSIHLFFMYIKKNSYFI